MHSVWLREISWDRGPASRPAPRLDPAPGAEAGAPRAAGWKGGQCSSSAVDSFLKVFNEWLFSHCRIVHRLSGIHILKSKPPYRISWFVPSLAGLFDFNMSVFFKIDFSLHFFSNQLYCKIQYSTVLIKDKLLIGLSRFFLSLVKTCWASGQSDLWAFSSVVSEHVCVWVLTSASCWSSPEVVLHVSQLLVSFGSGAFSQLYPDLRSPFFLVELRLSPVDQNKDYSQITVIQ